MLFKRELKPDVLGNNQKNGTSIRESFNFNRLAFRQAWISESKHTIG